MVGFPRLLNLQVLRSLTLVVVVMDSQQYHTMETTRLTNRPFWVD